MVAGKTILADNALMWSHGIVTEGAAIRVNVEMLLTR